MSWVQVKLVHSPIGKTQKQHATVRGLGLRKCNNTRWLKDSPEVRGMVNKISHLVEIVAESEKEPDNGGK